MFRNLTLTIVTFYVVTIMPLAGVLHYTIVEAGVENQLALIVGTFAVTLLLGLMIARMAIAPLKEHFEHLERFSKETLHELNLPVSTILTNTKMLKRNEESEKSLKRLGRIEDAAKMIQERYSELDYLIRTQMQQETVEEFDLSELIRERVAFLQELYPQVQIGTELEAYRVTLDRIGLQKVIDNLVDNAVKYTAKASTVEVRLSQGVLEVRDRGIGMDEMELLRIFDRYYQSDATMPGYGIGLGLVKSYCDKHKIKLHVQSEKGVGTTMILDFKGV
ncbi:MAG: HAMP domain-containing sensor histidine kinase [Sulfurimonadaceae bacterium]|nr:HAMP domain-containing sensor histidine kinase [Sulfurimonadaceae bacterium]